MKKSIFTILAFTALNLAVSALPFNSKLSSQEKQTLESGEVLIRNIDSIKDICVNETEETKKIISTMKKLDPAYVAEVIQVRPYKGNENLKEEIDKILCNIEGYVGIPYYSQQAEKWYELYSSAEIKNINQEGEDRTIDCILEMSLFGKFNAQIDITDNKDFYYYETKNIDKLVYHEKFTAVKPEKMKSCITIFRDGDNWILYAIGGVDCPKVWFLSKRIEISFMNRIKTFCNFIFSKI